MPSPLLTRPEQDPQDMRAAIRAFPTHLQAGWDAAERVDADPAFLPLRAADLAGVVVVGMGGSAIGGDLVRTLVAPTAPVPVEVVRDYTLPAWVGPRALVIASSYSGGTEETLAAYAEATARGARLLVVTSGGEIAGLAAAAGQPVVAIPGGMQPRAALGYSLGALLRVARALGLHELPDADFAAAVDAATVRADAYSEDVRTNPARELSGGLVGTLPVVYAAPGLLEAVAMRWRTQIHENAKHPAVGNLFPELDHNEIMGFEAGPPAVLGAMDVLVLRDRDDHPQTVKRYAATRELVARTVAGWRELETEGATRLERMLSLVQLGDAVSFWLAMRKGVDPTPVETIQALKRTLAG